MRNLFLLRHAKSSWKDASLSDFDRPLSNRGKQDAPLIARQFLKNKIEIDLIISSSARRTLETGKIFENVLRLTSKILKDDNLYDASSYDMLKTITQINDNIRNVIIVCHNPGITNLANYLSNIVFENIPTTGLVGFSFEGNWKDINGGECKFLFYEYPKKFK